MPLPNLVAEFPLQAELMYLNHAAVAPWPARTSAAVMAFAEENLRYGAQHYPAWVEVEHKLRMQLAWLIGARSGDEIALLKNTSEGLSIIAQGLAWQPGDNVVIPAQEFPSNRVVWEALIPAGVQVRKVDIQQTEEPEAALLAQIDSRTRLLSVSSVQFDSGLRLDLARLGKACEDAEILFCVDAIQSLGVVPMDVRRIRADFVVADGHKWLLGPEGLALFYCRRELLDTLTLHQFGWHMLEHPGDFERQEWQPAHSARRFECGSPNMLGIHALSASLSLFEEIGMDACQQGVLDNTAYLIERLTEQADRYTLVTPPTPDRHAGIVSFKPRHQPVAVLHRRLMERQVICALRSGAIRFSSHFYTPRSVLDRALACLQD